jgi:hypothetical protein
MTQPVREKLQPTYDILEVMSSWKGGNPSHMQKVENLSENWSRSWRCSPAESACLTRGRPFVALHKKQKPKKSKHAKNWLRDPGDGGCHDCS